MNGRPAARLDGKAKAILRDRWPKTCFLFGDADDGRQWLRAQPAARAGSTHPRLVAAGAIKHKTQPDGLYVRFGEEAQFVDCVAIEVCASPQNLNDKRSRYAPSTSSIVLNVPHGWLISKCFEQQLWWQASRAFSASPPADLLVPIRHLRALYVLPNDHYREWVSEMPAAGHEYFMPISSMTSINADPLRKFLEKISPQAHFYSTNFKRLGARPRLRESSGKGQLLAK